MRCRGGDRPTFTSGTYLLVDAVSNTRVAGEHEAGYCHDLDNVQGYLNRAS